MLSTLCHTTIWPAGRLAGFGENDCAPLTPTTLMVTIPEILDVYRPGLPGKYSEGVLSARAAQHRRPDELLNRRQEGDHLKRLCDVRFGGPPCRLGNTDRVAVVSHHEHS
jgi:hypothetical protein